MLFTSSISGFCQTIIAAAIGALLAASAGAVSITGGDAASQADANAILDIVFAIDTSGSMLDEADGISGTINTIVNNLDCPNTDVWVRARFLGIDGTFQNTLFDENSIDYASANGATPIVADNEDNAPVISDIIAGNDLIDDSIATQRYVKAIVTIGDEGTKDGSPVNLFDYQTAAAANSTALSNGFIIFSLLGNNPSPGAADVFQLLAVGGQKTIDEQTFSFADTGGTFTETNSNTLEADLEAILCNAVQQRPIDEIPQDPTAIPTLSTLAMSTIALLLSLAGALGLRRR